MQSTFVHEGKLISFRVNLNILPYKNLKTSDWKFDKLKTYLIISIDEILKNDLQCISYTKIDIY